MQSRHDTPSRPGTPGPDRPSGLRSGPPVPARTAPTQVASASLRGRSHGPDHDDRPGATSDPTPTHTDSTPAAPSGPIDRRVAPRQRDDGPQERPAGDRDEQEPAVGAADDRETRRRTRATTAQTSVAMALVGLRRVRRQPRRQRAPRPGPEERRRPGRVRGQPLAAPAEDHRQLAGADRHEQRQRRELCPATHRRPQQRRDVGAGQDAADDARREVQAAGRRVQQPRADRRRRRPSDRARSRAGPATMAPGTTPMAMNSRSSARKRVTAGHDARRRRGTPR